MTPSQCQTLSFPGLTGESRKALDARLRPAGMMLEPFNGPGTELFGNSRFEVKKKGKGMSGEKNPPEARKGKRNVSQKYCGFYWRQKDSFDHLKFFFPIPPLFGD